MVGRRNGLTIAQENACRRTIPHYAELELAAVELRRLAETYRKPAPCWAGVEDILFWPRPITLAEAATVQESRGVKIIRALGPINGRHAYLITPRMRERVAA